MKGEGSDNNNNNNNNKNHTDKKTNRQPYESGNEEMKRLHFIPRSQKLANEKETNPYKEVAPRNYWYPPNEREDGGREHEGKKTRRENRERTDKRRNQTEERTSRKN